MTARADRLMEFLANEGYRPSLRSNGDIAFKHDGGHYVIRFDPSDAQCLAIAYPNFWQLEGEAELLRAYAAANRANVDIKAVKLLVFDESRQVWATLEVLADGTEPFEAMFDRVVSVLRAGVERFVKAMRESEPMDEGRIELTRGAVARFQADN